MQMAGASGLHTTTPFLCLLAPGQKLPRLPALCARCMASRSFSSGETAWRVQQSSSRPMSSSSPARITQYHGLEGDDFRHPLDQQNTRLLRVIPGLDMITRGLLGPVAEQVLLLENIATSVLVGHDQLPSLYKILTEAAGILQMDVPDLYVRQSPVPNAYTLAIAGRKPFIVATTALLDLLTLAEVQKRVGQRFDMGRPAGSFLMSNMHGWRIICDATNHASQAEQPA